MTTTTSELPEPFDLRSHNTASDKISELLRLFPEIRTEGGKLDFDRLKLALGESVDVGRERYGMNWPGKADCFKTIQAPSMGTLRPCREESVNFDTTENLIIEGDNLEVLKLLQKSYLGKVKMIYIDPPYNTGNDFIYPDNYSESLNTYLQYTGQVDDEGRKFGSNTEADGRFHSKWMNMMYPRLYLSRNLLKEDGFFLISIDDAEVSNLRTLMNDVLGEDNFVAMLVYDKNRKNDAKLFSVGHEYVAVYAKNRQLLSEMKVVLRSQKEGIDEVQKLFDESRKLHKDDWALVERDLREFYLSFEDDDPRQPLNRFSKVDAKGPYRTDGNPSWPGGGGPLYEVLHPITGKPCKKPGRGWVWSTFERMKEEIDRGNVIFGKDETTVPSVRSNLFEKSEQVMRSVIFSYAQKASQDFAKIFDGAKVFDNPKSFSDLQKLIQYLTNDSDLVLDFFAGSGTTAHGVVLSNHEDNATRKFICIQLPEPIDDSSQVGKAAVALCSSIDAPYTIAESTKERIRRVISGMQAERAELEREESGKFRFEPDLETSQMQSILGFRVFKLDQSNFNAWNSSVEHDSAKVERQLDLHIDHIRDNRTPEDILYELLLKSGFPLTTPVEQQTIEGKTVYSIAGGALMICLDGNLTLELIRAIAELKPERVVFLDEGFAGNDQLKANAVQTFKTKGVASFRTV